MTNRNCPNGGNARTLRYRPGYNEYKTAPTLVDEDTLAYKRFSGQSENLTLGSQFLVENRTVRPALLVGNYSRNGIDAVSLDAQAGEPVTRSVTDPTVTTPTGLPVTVW